MCGSAIYCQVIYYKYILKLPEQLYFTISYNLLCFLFISSSKDVVIKEDIRVGYSELGVL